MDVLGIGLANIDLVAHVMDSFLERYKLEKGQAKKLDDLEFGRLRGDLPSFRAAAGGCAANTLCGLSSAGLKTRFYGKIGSDSFESLYRASFRHYGVEYKVKASGEESSQCAVLVSPDGNRSFAYTQGASWQLSCDDFDFQDIWSARFVYAEIYTMEFGKVGSVWPFLINHLRQSKTPLILKVIDREYARLYSRALFALAEEGILMMIVGNGDNLPALVGKETAEEAAREFQKWSCAVLVTDGAENIHYICKNIHVEQKPIPVHTPGNTSGAGDQFVAGYIEGMLSELSLQDRLGLAERRAKEILMQDAPRPPLSGLQGIAF